MSAEELKQQLNDADTNQVNWLEEQEIEDFLVDDEKVQSLWDTMWNLFESQPEWLLEYKKSIWNICKRILEEAQAISPSQAKILFFYLKHFHNEDDVTGMKIIKNIVYQWKGDWYKNIIPNINQKIASNPDGELDEASKINLRFNNLPWVQKTKEDRCEMLLQSPVISEEEIKRLEEYKWVTNLWEEIMNKIEEKLEIEKVNKDIEAKIYNDPLVNLEMISPWFGRKTPKWSKIVDSIKRRDVKNETDEDINNLIQQITTTITAENIWEFLNLPEGISEWDKGYITANFQTMLIKHLILHPWYKLGYWDNPNEKRATGMTLNDMVKDNELITTAYKKLVELKGNRKTPLNKLDSKKREWQLREELNNIFSENNHVLFDLRLKETLSSCNEKDIRNVTKYIIDYSTKNYPSKLTNFSNKNGYIKNIIQECNKIKETNKNMETCCEYIDEIERVDIPEDMRNLFKWQSSFLILSRNQLTTFKDHYDKIKPEEKNNEIYTTFCKLYELSDDFYKSQRLNNLQLPTYLEPKDIINFFESLKSTYDDIDKIEHQAQSTYTSFTSCPWWSPVASPLSWMLHYSHYEDEKTTCKLPVVRKFVELWKRSPWPYRPPNFIWIPLNRKKSDTDEIIRDTGRKQFKDKITSFRENATGGCFQQAFWDLVWLAAWIAAVALTRTSGAAAGALFYLSSNVGNAAGQVLRDTVIDGTGAILWREGNGANKYDWLDASLGLWLWLYWRDENWNVIQRKTLWEWTIDMLVGTAFSSLTWEMANVAGISLLETPFKYAIIDQFVGQPLANITSAGLNASFQTENYKGKTPIDAINIQSREEMSFEWITKKLVNILAMTAVVKSCNGIRDLKILWNINNKITNINNFLASKWFWKDINVGKITPSEINGIMKNGLPGLVDDLFTEVQKWWNKMVIPTMACTALGIYSETLSPTNFLDRKIDSIITKIQTAKDENEKNQFTNTLAAYLAVGTKLPDIIPNSTYDKERKIELAMDATWLSREQIMEKMKSPLRNVWKKLAEVFNLTKNVEAPEEKIDADMSRLAYFTHKNDQNRHKINLHEN